MVVLFQLQCILPHAMTTCTDMCMGSRLVKLSLSFYYGMAQEAADQALDHKTVAEEGLSQQAQGE